MPSDKIVLNKFHIIHESVLLILDRFKDVNEPDDFMTTPYGVMKLDSIAMRLQSIGESIKKIDKYRPELLGKYNDVDWNDIIKFRDFISHHYDLINPEIIYNACKVKLPALQTTIEKIIKENFK
ncbi:MAG TPA: DUF86 domain-containing protein [Ignavibacteria bacterium]|nr:toxin-antitoxin system antitoxin subunit [Bacteroidota bacterium]HRE12056.1 DUF86 domain-containing protein [Ignavibacteria bacterium]HRF65239.1 DUF86 domain-containing protein [Ignavibacteria bacterium]HRJ05227.1 DUF86 domain-containing protein [Ignavibacteria bacterium]